MSDHNSQTIDQTVDDIAETFDLLGDWEERYRHIIDLGRDLPELPADLRTEGNRVRGCASQVWLVSECGPDGRLRFRGDSDAHIVRGLVALILSLYSGRTRDEVIGFDARAALSRLGLTEALSRQRSNGLFSMIERIQQDAASAS